MWKTKKDKMIAINKKISTKKGPTIKNTNVENEYNNPISKIYLEWAYEYYNEIRSYNAWSHGVICKEVALAALHCID